MNQQPTKLHPVEQSLADELGPSFSLVLSSGAALDRLIGKMRSSGEHYRYELKAQPLESGAAQRVVEIEIFNSAVSQFFPIIRTGEMFELDAYREATQQLMYFVNERRVQRQDQLHALRGGGSYAERVQLRLI